ncbi:unnamed protein product, partial [Ixodes persulcatus]
QVILCCLVVYIIAQRDPPPVPYSFSYDNTDDFGTRTTHSENSDNNNAKTGSYGYTDATGTYRYVTYVADGNGYRATVDTNEPGTKSSAPADVRYDSKAPVVAAPAAAPRPRAVAVHTVHHSPLTLHAVHSTPVQLHAVHSVPVLHLSLGRARGR